MERVDQCAARGRPTRRRALAALFCLTAVRLATRVDSSGTLVPLAEQDRTRWNRDVIARGVRHLGASATGERWTRWHLEAGIALEHATAASVDTTDWKKIVAYYDALLALCPGPVVALNRALAIAELRGPDAGQLALAVVDDPRLTHYSLYWAGLADLARRARRTADAIAHYERASLLARSHAERRSYERRLRELAPGCDVPA